MCQCSWELNSDEYRGLAMKFHHVEVTVGLDKSDLSELWEQWQRGSWRRSEWEREDVAKTVDPVDRKSVV